MIRHSIPFGLAMALALVWPAESRADAPKINDIVPAGVQRGVASPVTIQGGGLAANPTLIAPFPAEVGPAPEGQASDAGNWRFTLSVAPETPVGVYQVRVRTEDGISNPFLLAVGQVPQVAEQEGNNTIEAAQAVPSPVVVEGRAQGNDVDVFRFPGKTGQRIVVDARCARIGSGVDPAIRLTTADGQFVASEDDAPGLLTDARITAELPEDGEYAVQISDSQYRGGGRPVYRLLIGPVPVAAEVYPIGGQRGQTVGLELRGGALPGVVAAAARLEAPDHLVSFHPRIPGALVGPEAAATGLDVELPHALIIGRLPELREPASPGAPTLRVAPPAVINGRLGEEGEDDRFVVDVRPNTKYRASVRAVAIGSAMDGVLRVLRPDGNQIAEGDDSNIELSNKGQKNAQAVNSPDPSVEFDVPDGVTEVTLSLRDLSSRGGTGFPYRITVEEVSPRFEVELAVSEVSIPRGGAVNVPVNVARYGVGGPVTLRLADPPEGLTVREGTVPLGQSAGVLSVLASADAEIGTEPLTVIGEAEGPDGPITVTGEKAIVFADLNGFPTHVRVQRGLAAATASPSPIVLETPTDPIEVVHGHGAEVPVTVSRADGVNVPLEIEALPMPGGLAVPKATIAEDASTGAITVNAAPEAPLGPASIAFTAKGKIDGADRTFAVPAVTVRVVPPASLSLAASTVDVKAGESVEVKGTIARKGPFQQPVTVSLDGLPAGVTAEPVTVPGDASAFTLSLSAAPDAAAGMAVAKASAAFKLGDKDYPPPSTTLTVKVVPKDG